MKQSVIYNQIILSLFIAFVNALRRFFNK